MIRKVFLITLIFISLGSQAVLAADPQVFVEASYRTVVTEILDLRLDGSIQPVFVNSTGDFDYIQKATFVLVWDENSVDYSEFGSGGTLVNGTKLYYDNQQYYNGLKSVEDFVYMSYDSIILVDDKNPIGNHLIVRVRYNNAVPPHGLKMAYDHSWQVKISDNITAVCEIFAVTLTGFKVVHLDTDFTYDFLEDISTPDNILEIVIYPFVFPLIWIFTLEPVYVIFGLLIIIAELLFIRVVYVSIKKRRY